MIIEKIGDVFAAYTADTEHDEREREIRQNRAEILGTHDIQYFPTHNEGYKHSIRLAETATDIRNVVLRYGERDTTSRSDDIYREWVDAKVRAARRNVPFKEIVSTHLKSSDLGRKFIRGLESDANYRPRTIDDKAVPMMQMIIFRFGKEGEVVFGWEFHDHLHGACFASRNIELVNFFERYFDLHFRAVASQELIWADDKFPVSTVDTEKSGPLKGEAGLLFARAAGSFQKLRRRLASFWVR